MERVLGILKSGEGERVEFKEKSDRVAESISAFANTDGGCVLIGVSNAGEIIGAGERDLEKLSSYMQSLSPLPKLKVEKIAIGKKFVIIVEVQKSGQLVSIGNLAYVRAGTSNKPLSIEELAARAIELGKVRFDESLSWASLKLLRKKYLNWYFKRREELRGVKRKGTLLQNIKNLKIAGKKNGKNFLTWGGLLFFSSEPQKFLPNSKMRVVELTSEMETKEVTEFSGPIWKIVEDCYAHILSKVGRIEVRVGAGRKKIFEYPEGAIREALINAVAHRNYAIPADTRVFVSPGKLIIRSPGSFPPGVSAEEPEHIPRNPLLCQYLYDTGFIERYGFGIIKMREETKHHPLVELDLRVTPAKVDVVFLKTKEHPALDDVDRKIISLAKEPISSSEIASEVGMSKPAMVKRLNALVALRILRKVGRGAGTRYLS